MSDAVSRAWADQSIYAHYLCNEFSDCHGCPLSRGRTAIDVSPREETRNGVRGSLPPCKTWALASAPADASSCLPCRTVSRRGMPPENNLGRFYSRCRTLRFVWS